MDIKHLYAHELKRYISHKIPKEKIGTLTFSFYWKYIENIDLDFEEILLTLNKMELGPEFEFTYEELEQIADDLIAGKEVKL